MKGARRIGAALATAGLAALLGSGAVREASGAAGPGTAAPGAARSTRAALQALAAGAPAGTFLLARVEAADPALGAGVAFALRAVADTLAACGVDARRDVAAISFLLAPEGRWRLDLEGALRIGPAACLLKAAAPAAGVKRVELGGGAVLMERPDGVRLGSAGAIVDGKGADPALATLLEGTGERARGIVVARLAAADVIFQMPTDDAGGALVRLLFPTPALAAAGNARLAAALAEVGASGVAPSVDGRAVAFSGTTLSVASAVRAGLFELSKLPSASMAPTYWPGDALAVLKGPLAAPPVRGDVVTYARPDAGTIFVKRVVALGGETVSLDEAGALYVAGKPLWAKRLAATYDLRTLEIEPGAPLALAELWLEGAAPPKGRRWGILRGPRDAPLGVSRPGSWTTPAGELFLLGDHRDNSHDSRHHGAIVESWVLGRVVGVAYSVKDSGVRWERTAAPEGRLVARVGMR